MTLEPFKNTLKIFSPKGKVTIVCQVKSLDSDISVKTFEWGLSFLGEAPRQAIGQNRGKANEKA